MLRKQKPQRPDQEKHSEIVYDIESLTRRLYDLIGFLPQSFEQVNAHTRLQEALFWAREAAK